MSPTTMLVFVLLAPAVAAAVAAALMGWAGRRLDVAGGGAAAAALALGVGEWTAHLPNARPAFPPIDVTDRIPWLVLAAVLLGLCESIRSAPGWARWENRLILVLLTLGLILGPVLGPDWPTWPALAVQGGLVLLLLAEWANLEALAARRSTATVGPALLVVAAGAGASLLLSGSLVLGQVGLGLAAGLGAVWLLSCWLPHLSLSRGATPVLVVTVGALLINGQVYAFLPRTSALILAVAPLAAWVASVGPSRRLAEWQAAVLGAVATLVPTAVAVGLAVAASPSYE